MTHPVNDDVRARFDALRQAETAGTDDLDALWADLSTVTVEEVLGPWRGEASLWEVAFRGESTATMVYDRMPVLDHVKAVDSDTLMGIMNGKLESAFGVSDLYYFWLERQAEESR